MDSKADVKAIMARFQTGGTNGTEGGFPSHHAGHPKTGLHPTLSSGPPPQPKKPVLESLSGSAVSIPPKPNFLRSSVSTKSAPEVREPPNAKALASRFANAQEESNSKPLFPNKPFKPPLSQDTEGKSPVPKPPLQKPSLSSTLPESKPAFPKHPPGLPSNSKPPWVKEDVGDSPSVPSPTPLKLPPLQQKPSIAIAKLRLQNDEVGGANTDSSARPFHSPNPTLKLSSSFRTAQSAFNKDKSTDQSEEGSKGEGANKLPLGASNSTPPPKPPPSKKPSFVRRQVALSSQTNSISEEDPLAPKRNPLPNSLALGPAPSKPNRPPRVNLERFRRGAETATDGSGPFKKTVVPPPPASHPSNHSNPVTPPLPSHPPAPSLPPRPPGGIIQPDPDENYDDVGVMNNAPPPLPPSTGHPSQRGELPQEDGSDDEMYEDLDERWEAVDIKEQEKKREKDKKEKKEKKDRGKKEQEARKKFKLLDPLQVVHRVKARVDNRGSRTELSLKQGDCVDIMRVNGNPEGKWLGRTTDGAYGYVKIDSVEIDFDSLKRQGEALPTQEDYDPEVYDDIDVIPHDKFNSAIKGRPVVLPPPPEEDGEIYDDVVDPSLDVSPSSPPDIKSPPKPRGFLRMFEWKKPPACTNEVPPPSQFTEGNSDQSASAIDEEIYDDVDSHGFPPPPPAGSLPTLRGKTKTEDMDPKKQKKFEKEEKDFRKKFKYEGEVQVLYEVTIVPNLTNKKWSSKDLPIKPGETLDVIVKAVDNKLICRNDEGKFGYVSTSHVAEDADIYDDIGDGCIYDND